MAVAAIPKIFITLHPWQAYIMFFHSPPLSLKIDLAFIINKVRMQQETSIIVSAGL
jgi:hypothetical protein